MMPIPALPDSPSQFKDTLHLPNLGSSSAGTGQSTAETMAMTPTDINATNDGSAPAPTSGSADAPNSTSPAKKMMTTPKATASRNRDTRLPSARTGSVFDRLYKTQTAASKSWTPVRAAARRGGGNFSTPTSAGSSRGGPTGISRRTPPSARSAGSTSSSVEDPSEIFQRLHISGTVANASKRLSSKYPPRFSPNKTMRSPGKNIPSTRTPLKASARKSPSSNKPGYVYSPRMKPLTALYFDSKYHPGIGREKVDPIKLGYSFFQNFCEYENGGLSSEQIAREIIIAFFKKDFPSARHWELHEPTVEQRPGEDHGYNVKMCATYDWQDAFRIASAQGVVRCKPEERQVSVLNYIYDVTSDL